MLMLILLLLSIIIIIMIIINVSNTTCLTHAFFKSGEGGQEEGLAERGGENRYGRGCNMLRMFMSTLKWNTLQTIAESYFNVYIYIYT